MAKHGCLIDQNYSNFVNVFLLRRSCMLNIPFPKYSIGSDLIQIIFKTLNVPTKDHQYFGFKFFLEQDDNEDLVIWANLNKSIHKQWSKMKSQYEHLREVPTLHLRVKFFPKDPTECESKGTQEQFYLQIKYDVLSGKLPCSINTACLLASYVAQAELGDYIAIDHKPGYLTHLELFRGQNVELERRVSDLHKLHRGQERSDAIFQYLMHAKGLDLYGVDLYNTADCPCGESQVGVTLSGLLVYKNGIRVQTVPWAKIRTTSFSKKHFQIDIKDQCGDSVLHFDMESIAHAKALWRSSAEHYAFTRGHLSRVCIKRRKKDEGPSATKPNHKPVKQKSDQEAKVCKFKKSMSLLSKALACKSFNTAYEQVYHKNPLFPLTEAKKIENHPKNRYNNVLPCTLDCDNHTRVILRGADGENYINANHVKMKITADKANHYIATQGPLSNTVRDFWRMVQQENTHLIVMLTTVKELGADKCHQYWPDLGETDQISDDLSIKCITEQPNENGTYVLRELTLIDKKRNEKRTVQHMQYLGWPDHGVPTETFSFLHFINRLEDVRTATRVHQCFVRAADPPIIVHCSAGIGRTGVLILIDTAFAMLKAKEPIYPMRLLHKLRDQRPYLVQHLNQFRFACECIIKLAKLADMIDE